MQIHLLNGQILNFGWREGISAEEAKPFAEEALRFARGSGDRSHEPLLLGAYGRILSASGAADDYVRLVGDAIVLSGIDRMRHALLDSHGEEDIRLPISRDCITVDSSPATSPLQATRLSNSFLWMLSGATHRGGCGKRAKWRWP